jgi:hypothetical protein
MQDTAWYDFIVTNFSDDDVPTEPCTSKATIFTAFMAAGHIGRAVRMIVTGAHKAGVLTHDIRNEELEGWAS